MRVSIVIPTLNEVNNILRLVMEVRRAMKKDVFEIIFVDDNSNDGTCQVIKRLSRKYNNIKLLKRRVNKGLSTAVVDGFRKARGDVFVVLDADLQHPPEIIPKLVEKLDEFEFVVGSREFYAEISFFRRFISKFANFFVLSFLNLPIRDSMSGFFAIRKSVFEHSKKHIRPRGYKIMLEILVKSKTKSVVEIPFVFQKRYSGVTKVNVNVFLSLLVQLVDNLLFKIRQFFNIKKQ